MRKTALWLSVWALVVCAGAPASAGVIGMFWEKESPSAFDLYAAVTMDTVILNADLGDDTIDLPPDGVNTGLYSWMGEIIGAESFLTMGGMAPSFARPFTITPSGSGSFADAAWFLIAGAAADPHPNDLSDYAVWLGHFEVTPGGFIGGDLGGPNRDIQSRIFLGWEDMTGAAEFGVFNVVQVPAPGALALLGIGMAAARSRKRREL